MSVQRFSKATHLGFSPRAYQVWTPEPQGGWDVLTATETGATVALSWTAAGGSPVSYEVAVGSSITDVGNVTSHTLSSLTIGTKYDIKVRPVYSDGSRGGWSQLKNRGPMGYNNATGGTITTVTNYNGTGQTWRVHSFTSNGTFQVTETYGVYPFRTLVLGGGAGGCGIYAGNSGTSGAGYSTASDNTSLSVGSYSVTVGGGGGGYCCSGSAADSGHGSNGGSSSLGTITANGGAHHTSTPSTPFNSDITGTVTSYGSNSAGNAWSGPAPTRRGEAGVRSGIHGTGGPNPPSGAGIGGIVVVSYRIG